LSSGIKAEEMHAIDVNCEYLGVSRLMLMENAGAETAKAILRRVNVKGKKVVIVAHTGNKGGDGFVTARHLSTLGAKVLLVLLGDPEKIRTDEARRNWKIVCEMESSIERIIIKDSSMIKYLAEAAREADIIIDALLGTGIRGTLRSPILEAVKIINEAGEKGAYIVSIDIPTGINPNTGEILGAAIKANLTVTHHKPKIGMLTKEAKNYVGELYVANIGIPPEAELFTGPGDVLIAIKERKPTAHKGEFGRIVIIGGSKDYTGAPALAALAALRAGADLTIIIAPSRVASAIRSYSPNLIVREYQGEYLNDEGVTLALTEAEKADAIIIGPGLSLRSKVIESTTKLIEELKNAGKKIVIDADAIKACSTKTEVLKELKGVITPHAGEFRILTGEKLPPEEEGWKKRIEIVRREAEKLKITILLKAHYDIISNGTRVKVNRTGNPGMTVGGTGDVLAGLTAAFLAWGDDPFKAAVASSFINGLAGDIAVQEKGYHILASDLLEAIPKAFMIVEKYKA